MAGGSRRNGRNARVAAAFVAVACGMLALAATTAAGAPGAGNEPSRPSRDAADSDLTLIGQVGGPTRAAAVANGVAFVGRGPRVHVFAICRPHVPIHIGQTDVLPGPVLDILVNGRYAYAAVGPAGLVVLDVARPAHPTVVRTVSLYGVAARLVPEGDRLYVVSGYGGLRILTTADPSAPRELGHFQAVVSDVAVRGDYAYVVKRDFTVVDTSDPTAPRQLRKLADWADSVALQGTTMVVAVSSSTGGGSREGALQVYDVSDPRTPRARGSLPIGPPARLMRFLQPEGSLAAFQPTYARLVDVSDLERPRDVTGFAAPGTVSDADDGMPDNGGAYLVLSAGASGLRVVDMQGAAPREVWIDEPLSNAQAVAVSDGVAFVEDESVTEEKGTRVRVFDLRSPAEPHPISQLPLAVAHEAMVAADQRLYIGDPSGTVHVADVSRPERPHVVGRLDLGEAIWGLVGEGARLVVAADEHVRVLDVANPSAPREVGSARASGGATALALSGGTAFVTGPATGLETGRPSLMAFDVATPGRVREIGVMPDAAGWRHGVASLDGMVYVDGLQVVDARDATAMREVARIAVDGDTRALTIGGGRLYSAQRLTGGGRLLELDLSDPALPVQHSSIDLVDEALDVAVWRGYAFVAAKEAGLIVVASDAAEPPPRPSPPAGLPETAYLPLAAKGPIGPPCP